jgi:hypothetical protein
VTAKRVWAYVILAAATPPDGLRLVAEGQEFAGVYRCSTKRREDCFAETSRRARAKQGTRGKGRGARRDLPQEIRRKKFAARNSPQEICKLVRSGFAGNRFRSAPCSS